MIIDLTHTLNNTISVYPGTTHPKFESTAVIIKDGYAEHAIEMRSHAGTHIDAPCHIIPNAKSLDQIPLENFMGRGCLIDCSARTDIDLDFLKQYEHKIKEADFVLFYTGWHRKWKTEAYFWNFPILTIKATEYLVQFDLKAVGFDTISADKVACTEIPNHKVLLANEVMIIENLSNLDQLLSKDFEFSCIPLKVEKADGSPIRAFAKI